MPEIGDPVEVRFRNRIENEVWRPATVSNVRDGSIGVTFADHSRMQVRNGQWRAASPRSCKG